MSARVSDCGCPVRVPEAGEEFTRQVVGFVQRLRQEDLFKLPGLAESIDWTRALFTLSRSSLDHDVVNETLGVLLKYEDDLARVRGEPVAAILQEVG